MWPYFYAYLGMGCGKGINNYCLNLSLYLISETNARLDLSHRGLLFKGIWRWNFLYFAYIKNLVILKEPSEEALSKAQFSVMVMLGY